MDALFKRTADSLERWEDVAERTLFQTPTLDEEVLMEVRKDLSYSWVADASLELKDYQIETLKGEKKRKRKEKTFF
jgi:hypothetical protein